MTTLSAAYFERAKELIPGGVNSPVRAFKSVGGNPVFIKSAKGAYLHDVDGNSYIDLIGSWGPMLFGQAHPVIENAVKEATPIFVDAVVNMSFSDATTILMGNESAATQYLENSTSTALYGKFNPVIQNSFRKVGADKVWSNIITKYNSIPLVKKVNPDLTDYVTNQAMQGVFKMIAVEEKNIRTNLSSRTSPLLQKVFAMQDHK